MEIKYLLLPVEQLLHQNRIHRRLLQRWRESTPPRPPQPPHCLHDDSQNEKRMRSVVTNIPACGQSAPPTMTLAKSPGTKQVSHGSATFQTLAPKHALMQRGLQMWVKRLVITITIMIIQVKSLYFHAAATVGERTLHEQTP